MGLKNIFIENGEIELFSSDKLLYDEKFLIKRSVNNLTFKNYRGRLGVNDSAIEITGDANVKGFIEYPTHISTKGAIDIIVVPHISVSIRSAVDGGTVNDSPLKRTVPYFTYGNMLGIYANDYIRPNLVGDFVMSRVGESFYAHAGKKYFSVTILDLCKENNLVLIESEKHPPKIIKAHSIDEIINADFPRLLELKKFFVDGEKYEHAHLVKKEIERRLNN